MNVPTMPTFVVIQQIAQTLMGHIIATVTMVLQEIHQVHVVKVTILSGTE